MPRQSGQVGFGQRADHALGFKRLEQHVEGEVADDETAPDRAARAGALEREVHVAERAAGNRVGAAKADAELTVGAGSADAEAGVQLLADRPLHLGEADLQHDLLRAAHDHQVRDPIRRIAVGEVQRPVQLGGRGDGT